MNTSFAHECIPAMHPDLTMPHDDVVRIDDEDGSQHGAPNDDEMARLIKAEDDKRQRELQRLGRRSSHFPVAKGGTGSTGAGETRRKPKSALPPHMVKTAASAPDFDTPVKTDHLSEARVKLESERAHMEAERALLEARRLEQVKQTMESERAELIRLREEVARVERAEIARLREQVATAEVAVSSVGAPAGPAVGTPSPAEIPPEVAAREAEERRQTEEIESKKVALRAKLAELARQKAEKEAEWLAQKVAEEEAAAAEFERRLLGLSSMPVPDAAAVDEQTSTTVGPASEEPELADEDRYVRYYSDDGIPYYHNAATGETLWELPEGVAAHEPSEPPLGVEDLTPELMLHCLQLGLEALEGQEGRANALEAEEKELEREALAAFREGPPGPFLSDGLPDMRYKRNRQFYESFGIDPQHELWGQMPEPEQPEFDESQMEDELEKQPPPPRPSFPLVSFGFGGQLLVMFPTLQTTAIGDENTTAADTNTDINVVDGDVDSGSSANDAQPEPGAIEVYKLSALLADDPEIVALAAPFPGPLCFEPSMTRGVVIQYVEDEAERAESVGAASLGLLWRLLGILCRHSGWPRQLQIVDQAENNDPATAEIAALLTSDNAPMSSWASSVAPTAENIAEIGRLVAIGRKAEACRAAIRCGAWSHALLLASRIGSDGSMFEEVTGEFSRQTLGPGHPLQFLYSLYAGQGPLAPPAVSPPCADLADWRASLATIMTNPVRGDVTTIEHLAQSLVAVGDVEAAHICYLCAEHTPDPCRFDSAATLTLLGLGSAPSPAVLPPVHTVRLTEVLEFARAQASEGADLQGIHGFHTFKLALAAALADAGHTDRALQYCNSMARQIQCTPQDSINSIYSLFFLTQLRDLAASLRGHGARVRKAGLGTFWREDLSQIIRAHHNYTEPRFSSSMVVEPEDVVLTAAVAAPGVVPEMDTSDAGVDEEEFDGFVKVEDADVKSETDLDSPPIMIASNISPTVVTASQPVDVENRQTTSTVHSSAPSPSPVPAPAPVLMHPSSQPMVPVETAPAAMDLPLTSTEESVSPVGSPSPPPSQPPKSSPIQPLPPPPAASPSSSVAQSLSTTNTAWSYGQQSTTLQPNLTDNVSFGQATAINEVEPVTLPVDQSSLSTDYQAAAKEYPGPTVPPSDETTNQPDKVADDALDSTPPPMFNPNDVPDSAPPPMFNPNQSGGVPSPMAPPFSMDGSAPISTPSSKKPGRSKKSRYPATPGLRAASAQSESPAPPVVPAASPFVPATLEASTDASASPQPSTSESEPAAPNKTDNSTSSGGKADGGSWLSSTFLGNLLKPKTEMHLGREAYEWSDKYKAHVPTDPEELKEWLAEREKSEATPPPPMMSATPNKQGANSANNEWTTQTPAGALIDPLAQIDAMTSSAGALPACAIIPRLPGGHACFAQPVV